MNLEIYLITILIITVIGIIGKAFFTKAGNELYDWLKAKISPPAYEVEKNFQPPVNVKRSYAWVAEVKLNAKEEEGYIYYLHPKNKGKCFRKIIVYGNITGIEYLMYRE